MFVYIFILICVACESIYWPSSREFCLVQSLFFGLLLQRSYSLSHHLLYDFVFFFSHLVIMADSLLSWFWFLFCFLYFSFAFVNLFWKCGVTFYAYLYVCVIMLSVSFPLTAFLYGLLHAVFIVRKFSLFICFSITKTYTL